MKLKLYKQTPGYCGPSSLRIVLDYYSIKKTEGELAKLIGATRNDGCEPWDIVKGAKKLGFDAYYQKNSSISGLKKFINKNMPIIIYWSPSPGHGHYSVIADIKKNKVFI